MAGIDPTLYEAAQSGRCGQAAYDLAYYTAWHSKHHHMLFILKLGHLLDAGFDQIYILYNMQVYPVADILDTWVYPNRSAAVEFQFGVSSRIVQVRHWAHLGARGRIAGEEVGGRHMVRRSR